MNTADPKPVLILVVEDEPLVRMLISDILTEDGGYRVIEAVNADEALTLLEARHDVRLVLTDVDMPGTLNGFALARTIDLRFPGVKVIVASGRMAPGPGDLPNGVPFLSKPFAPSALLKITRQALGPADSPIMIPTADNTANDAGAPVRPAAIKIDQSHTGIGIAGGLAQPLPEPEE